MLNDSRRVSRFRVADAPTWDAQELEELGQLQTAVAAAHLLPLDDARGLVAVEHVVHLIGTQEERDELGVGEHSSAQSSAR